MTDLKSIEFQEVKISRINSDDLTYRITTRTDISGLTASIEAVGLIAPPILTSGSDCQNQAFTIVSGFRRIAACRRLGVPRIQARIINPDIKLPVNEASGNQHENVNLECVQTAIADNAQQRHLNLMEQARSVALLMHCLDDERQVLETASRVTGIRMNLSLQRKLQRIATLSTVVQQLLLTEIISLNTALELGDLTPEMSQSYAEYFENLKLSFSNQKEFMLLTGEIAKRENIPLSDVLNDTKLKQTLHDQELPRNQRTSRIRALLKKRRFPALCAAENEFEKYVKALHLDPKIRLIPPKYFEGREYTLTMSFNNLQELQMHKNTLDRIMSHPVIKKICE